MYSIRLQSGTTMPKRVAGGEGMDHGILLLTEAAEYVFRDFFTRADAQAESKWGM